MRAAVEHAAASMRSRFTEPITLQDLAAEVFVSPFHFSRVFSSTVGVTPGRYLTAVRLFEAKRRLLATDDTIADIVCSVGYSSVGTFTSRFTRAVGLTPGQFRDPVVREGMLAVSPEFAQVPRSEVLTHAEVRGPGRAALDVKVLGVEGADRVVVGAFEGAVPQGAPVALTTVDPDVGWTVLEGLPVGTWTVLAVAASGDGVRLARAEIAIARGEVLAPPVALEPVAPCALDAPIAVSVLAPAQGLPGPTVAAAGTARHLRAVA